MRLIYPLLIVVLLTGCKKRYDDGTNFSLRTHDTRLCKTWQFDGYGTTGAVDYYTLILKKDGSAEYKFSKSNIQATWAWQDDYNKVLIGQDYSGSSQYIAIAYDIIELSKDKLHLRYKYSGGEQHLYFHEK